MNIIVHVHVCNVRPLYTLPAKPGWGRGEIIYIVTLRLNPFPVEAVT